MAYVSSYAHLTNELTTLDPTTLIHAQTLQFIVWHAHELHAPTQQQWSVGVGQKQGSRALIDDQADTVDAVACRLVLLFAHLFRRQLIPVPNVVQDVPAPSVRALTTAIKGPRKRARTILSTRGAA